MELMEREKSSPPAAQLSNEPWERLIPNRPPRFQVLVAVSAGSFLMDCSELSLSFLTVASCEWRQKEIRSKGSKIIFLIILFNWQRKEFQKKCQISGMSQDNR